MIERVLSFKGRSGRRAFLAVWAAAVAVLIPVGAGAIALIQAADRLGAPDAAIAALGVALMALAGFGYLRPVLAASVRRARDLGASALVLGLVVGVEVMDLAFRTWGAVEGVWVFGLYHAAVFLVLAVWPGRPEGEDGATRWALA